ncbi:hypothetical protein N0V92_006021 [Colletotrichum tropicale]|nr:hypothetical protein N0V92_006021 [Colletotrichum tropicale]
MANNWVTDNKWDWDREIIVVTGGSSGIGASIIKHIFARNPKATIVVVDLAPLSWEPPKGSKLHYFKCDLTDTAALKTLCTLIRTQVGDPTVLINNAGIARGATIMEGSYADIELTVKTNLIAPFLLTKEFLPYMVRRNHGHIVNIGSMSSVVPPVRIADYSATKAGLTAMHERAGPEWIWRLARETTASAKDIPYTPRQKINDLTGTFDLEEASKAKTNGIKNEEL